MQKVFLPLSLVFWFSACGPQTEPLKSSGHKKIIDKEKVQIIVELLTFQEHQNMVSMMGSEMPVGEKNYFLLTTLLNKSNGKMIENAQVRQSVSFEKASTELGESYPLSGGSMFHYVTDHNLVESGVYTVKLQIDWEEMSFREVVKFPVKL